MPTPKPVRRSPGNSTLTISLPQSLKEKIEEAAAEDKRKVSPWCVIQLERIIAELEAKSAPVAFKNVADDQSASDEAMRARKTVQYPKKKRNPIRLVDPPDENQKAK